MAIGTWGQIERNYAIEGQAGGAAVVMTPSGGSDANFPVSNLGTYAAWQQWGSGASGTQTLKIDMGGAVTTTAIAIINHNASSAAWNNGAPCKFQWSADGSTGWTDICTLDFTNNSLSETLDDGDDYFRVFTQVTAKRYYRINWTGTPIDKPKIGVVVVGRYFAYQEPSLGQLSYSWDYETDTFEGEGSEFVEQWGSRRVTVEMKRTGMSRFVNQVSPDFTAFQNQMALWESEVLGSYNIQQGNLRPMVFIPRPTSNGITDAVQGRCLYARYPRVPKATERFADRWDDGLTVVQSK